MARSGENGPNRSALRRTLEVALSNRKLSDELIDAIVELQASYNALLAKMDTDFTAQNAAVAGSQLDVDYESSLEVESVE